MVLPEGQAPDLPVELILALLYRKDFFFDRLVTFCQVIYSSSINTYTIVKPLRRPPVFPR